MTCKNGLVVEEDDVPAVSEQYALHRGVRRVGELHRRGVTCSG